MTLATYFWLVAFKGFRFRSSHGLQFLVLPPGKSKKHGLANGHANGVANGGAVPSALPIVFLHGLGIGLAQYVAFLKPLSKTTAGAVIMLQPNISTQIFHPRFLDPPPNEDYVKAIEAVCSSLDIDKATILSHSNGTMVHGCAWASRLLDPHLLSLYTGLLRGCPKLCYRNILVDPVCFRLWEGGAFASVHSARAVLSVAAQTSATPSSGSAGERP
jgi:pimeloyl-ACP methyl ester carboxylesterase